MFFFSHQHGYSGCSSTSNCTGDSGGSDRESGGTNRLEDSAGRSCGDSTSVRGHDTSSGGSGEDASRSKPKGSDDTHDGEGCQGGARGDASGCEDEAHCCGLVWCRCGVNVAKNRESGVWNIAWRARDVLENERKVERRRQLSLLFSGLRGLAPLPCGWG